MVTKTIVSDFLAVLKIALWIALAGVAAHLLSGDVTRFIQLNTDAIGLSAAYYAGLIGLLGYLSHNIARNTPIPSFVTALLIGIAVQPLLQPIAHNRGAFEEIVSIAAALILFQGGMETDFLNFRRRIWKIFLLAFPGVLVTAFLLSGTVYAANFVLNAAVPATVMVLLGGLLASTDPASVILLFRGMRFKEPTTKDIIVSESAMNDVVGAILTLSLIGFVAASGAFPSVFSGYSHLFDPRNVGVLIKQLGFGALAGGVGFVVLRIFSRHARTHGAESGARAIAFLSIILLTFYLAVALQGSGYLAAFLAGLVFQVSEQLQDTQRFFGGVIDGIAKPSIFLLLGTLVNIPQLLHYAPMGVVVGLLFILVIRPAVVFSMLGIFMKFGTEHLTVRQLLFISSIRETGAIPAVLLVTVSNLGIPGTEALVPIGMWVILLTLVLEPAATPFLARKLGLIDMRARV